VHSLHLIAAPAAARQVITSSGVEVLFARFAEKEVHGGAAQRSNYQRRGLRAFGGFVGATMRREEDEMHIRERIPADDIEIAYEIVGAGKPVVAVHGGPGLGHSYMRGIAVLADEYQVVFYDQRGTGLTELGDPDNVTFAGALADLEALREGLGIAKLNLIGHSFGSLVSLLYAASHADRAGSLVLYATAPPFIPELAKQLGARMAERRTREDEAEREAIEASEEFAERDPKTLERYFLNKYLPFFNDRTIVSKVDMGFTEITAANLLDAWQRTFRDLELHDPLASLVKITCPTLVIHCENDATPEEFSRLLADKIPSAEYALLPGTNHFAHVENPELFEATVKRFLKNHAA
jgi:proline iminopeptidase